jgi:acetyltransferase-like isoleucine patch superfamily enzyme
MRNAPKPIVLHRGSGRNVAMEPYLLNQGWTILAYVDEITRNEHASMQHTPSIDYATWRERLREIPCVVAALDSAVRRELVERLVGDGGSLAALNPSGSVISHQARFGAATFVDEGVAFVGSATTIGRSTIVLTPTSIAHDIVIGDFVTIYPSAAISGHVVIEDDVTIGPGAVIVNGRVDKPLRIGRGARLAASAVVTRSIGPGVCVAGNPARPLAAARAD